MKHNPFTSSTFETLWAKHFYNGNEIKAFKFIKGVKFVKHSYLPLLINVGKNLTKGISYTLDEEQHDYKGKTFLIYDVPTYFDIDRLNAGKGLSLRIKKIFQYQGFLMDISSYDNHEDYINAQFSSKNRREFRANMRKLETCFNIQYSFIYDEISRSDFDLVFNQFYELLNKRFTRKKTNYHHLSPEKWSYYSELVYEMLQVKKASLLVIYNEKMPIGVTLNFHSEDILFETITVFDSDYYKFSIGKTSIIKLLEWCFANNYRISDFSKGDFEYKHKWSNVVYDFNYHILYDSKSLKSLIVANGLAFYFKLKLFLREKGVNELYRKYKFMLSGGSKTVNLNSNQAIKFEKIEAFDGVPKDFVNINYNDESNSFLLQNVYTFAFANPEPIENIKVFQSSSDKKVFVISGTKKAQQITFS